MGMIFFLWRWWSSRTRRGWCLYNIANVLNTVEIYTLKWWMSCSIYFATIKKERIWGGENRTKITKKTKSPFVTPNCPFPTHLPASSPPFPKCMIMLALLCLYGDAFFCVFLVCLSDSVLYVAWIRSTLSPQPCQQSHKCSFCLQCRNIPTFWMPMFLLKWLCLSQKAISVEHNSGNQEDCGIACSW